WNPQAREFCFDRSYHFRGIGRIAVTANRVVIGTYSLPAYRGDLFVTSNHHRPFSHFFGGPCLLRALKYPVPLIVIAEVNEDFGAHLKSEFLTPLPYQGASGNHDEQLTVVCGYCIEIRFGIFGLV